MFFLGFAALSALSQTLCKQQEFRATQKFGPGNRWERLSEDQNFEWRAAASSPSAAARSTSNFFSSSIWTLVTRGSFGAVCLTAARPSSVCEPQGHVPGLRLRSWGMSPTSAPTLLRPATLPICLQVRVRTSGRERGGARNSTCGRSGRSGRSGRCWSRVLPCRVRDEQSVVQAASAWCEPREERTYLVPPHLCSMHHLYTVYGGRVWALERHQWCAGGSCRQPSCCRSGSGYPTREPVAMPHPTAPCQTQQPTLSCAQSVVSRHVMQGVVWYLGI